ncbi:MAG: glycine--tRNA ligase subunit beta [candidate division WOR-3 bacterium]
MAILLLEIGTEELPPGVVENAAFELRHRLLNLLSENNLPVGSDQLFWTPRRLAVRINDLALTKPAVEVEIQGPPKKAAFDADGNPTKTATGFARSHGRSVEDLYVKTTERGEYVFLKKTLPPVPTEAILGQELPSLISTLPFPKTMRWDDTGIRFSRPIRWILCLLDSSPIRFTLGSIMADRYTLGHRNFTSEPLPVSAPQDYEQLLLEHKVIADPKQRAAFIQDRLQLLACSVNGQIVGDKDLLEETLNITEYPEPLLGTFDPEFLKLPRPVLTTALRMHQRCFSIEDTQGNLLSCFIAVLNTPDCDTGLVRRWYEQAIESRLRDARFFVEADLKTGLEPLVEQEKNVTWIEGLGSYYDKTMRLLQICHHLAETASIPAPEKLDRAAYLCKADLLTNLVREKEFTALQGIVGSIYARLLGEDPVVAQAIGEHYLPKTADDPLPRSIPGALLSIADKIDNICATYLTGNIPTGSEDPFGVRRQATGILRIILHHGLPVAIDRLIETTLNFFAANKTTEIVRLILSLFQERLNALLIENGIPYDVANAVLSTVWHTPAEALARAHSLVEFSHSPDFEKLITGQKRVVNILRGQTVAGLPDPNLLTEPAEKELFNQAKTIEPELNRLIEQQHYHAALQLLLNLRPAIDRLFDDVLIMCPDEKIRTNRLKLLHYLRSLFTRIADLSEIVLEGIKPA